MINAILEDILFLSSNHYMKCITSAYRPTFNNRLTDNHVSFLIDSKI